MQIVCDLHIHNKYSGGASQNINIFKLASNSEKKGLNILSKEGSGFDSTYGK